SRQRALAEEKEKLEQAAASLAAQRAELESHRQAAEDSVSEQSRDLDQRTAALDRAAAEMQTNHDRFLSQQQRLREAGRRVGLARKSFSLECRRWRNQQENEALAVGQTRADLEGLRSEAHALIGQLPDLELRAQAAAERLAHSRQELRDH